MSLIKSYILSIEEMGFNPFNLDKLSSEEWDNLLTKALKSDKKLYQTLILIRCKYLTEVNKSFTNFNEVEEPF